MTHYTDAELRYIDAIKSAMIRGDKPFVAFLLAEYKATFSKIFCLKSLNN